jgi:hypothetical protein
VHLATLHRRPALNAKGVAEIFLNTLQDGAPQFRMHDLSTSEHDRRLDHVALLEKALDVIQLEAVIVIVDLGSEFYFLQLRLMCLLLLVLCESVNVLAVVHEAANRRLRQRRHFNEIESGFLGSPQRIFGIDNAGLFALCVDESNLRNTDRLVGAVSPFANTRNLGLWNKVARKKVGAAGLEPTTSSASGKRSPN